MMKGKQRWLALGGLLSVSLFVALLVGPAAAQSGPNLLTNPGFEEGHFNQDGIAEITVPNGWRMHYLDGVTFSDAFDGLPALRPETVVWNARGGVPAGEEVFWRDGIYTLKIFKSWAPMYAGISQEVSGLEVGRRYQLVAPVYADIYDWDGRKVPPADASHGQARLGASPVGAAWRNTSAIAYSSWFPTGYQNYNILTYEFVASQSQMTVWIDVKGTYPHSNNGFFIDTVALYALDAFGAVTDPGTGSSVVVPGVSGPTATPLAPPSPESDGSIVHVVQPGDTFWVIAVQYASYMGMTAEEALPRIQELNSNKTFLSVGDRLLIVPPQASAAQAAPEATPEAEAAPTEAAAAPAETGLVTAAGGAGDAGDSGAAPAPVAAEPQASAVCVSLFGDGNGNGVLDQGIETLLADAAVTLSRGGSTVATYVSDGLSDSYCFEDLTPDTYQVQFFPPANYRTTTDGTWAVVVAEGVRVPVSFGAQFGAPAAAEVAEVSETAEETAAAPTAAAAAAAETPAETGMPIGTIVIGVAVFLVVLAAIGVVLLRRA